MTHICGEDAEAFLNLKRKAGDADQTASVMGEKKHGWTGKDKQWPFGNTGGGQTEELYS